MGAKAPKIETKVRPKGLKWSPKDFKWHPNGTDPNGTQMGPKMSAGDPKMGFFG